MYMAKVEKKIDEMLESNNYGFLESTYVDKFITSKLYHYQELHLYNMIHSYKNNRIILDGSETGTGKTYVSVALCKHFNLVPLIIAPLIILSHWKSVCNVFNVVPLDIINYEAIKKINNTPYYTSSHINNKLCVKWILPHNSIIIFDEAHRCKKNTTLNGKLLLSTKHITNKVLLISGTIADTPSSFCIFGYMLDLYKTMKSGHKWIQNKLLEDRTSMDKSASSIKNEIFSTKGSRMVIKDIKNEFPDNQIIAECYDVTDVNKINEIYKKINDYQLSMKGSDNDLIISKILYMRMELELIKLPIIHDLINEYVENGYNVAVFLNFNESINTLAKNINTDCIIIGNQSTTQRDTNINDFQKNIKNVIICNIKSGSECISLHDIYGRPRVSLISPSFSSTELLQTLGRIHRIGSLSPALQRIIYCANTCETNICNILNDKLKFSKLIYDDDLIINYKSYSK